jgi:hypothetical protein
MVVTSKVYICSQETKYSHFISLAAISTNVPMRHCSHISCWKVFNWCQWVMVITFLTTNLQLFPWGMVVTSLAERSSPVPMRYGLVTSLGEMHTTVQWRTRMVVTSLDTMPKKCLHICTVSPSRWLLRSTSLSEIVRYSSHCTCWSHLWPFSW